MSSLSKSAGMIAVVLSFCLSGCSPSPCANLTSATNHLNSTMSGCPDQTPQTFNTAACNSGINQCNSSDIDALNASATCLNKIQACMTSSELNWAASVGLCPPPSGTLSSACNTSLSLASLTHPLPDAGTSSGTDAGSPVDAGSCAPQGQPCTVDSNCCSGLSCDPSSNTCN